MSNSPEQVESWLLIAEDTDAKQRLDVFLAKQITELSRSRIKDLILAGDVEIDGQQVCEPKHRVKPGNAVQLTKPPPVDAEPKPENLPLEILHEDDHLIVINKPVGMVVHPAPGAPDGTLVNALLYHCGDSLAGIGGVKRPGIVHRLDKDTSGVMVVAKTQQAHTHLSAQFADHGRSGPLRRAYLAFVWGHHPRFAGSIEASLGRDPHNRLKQAVRNDGRHAITHYQTLSRFGGEGWNIAKLECRLETGRTHQIRVHMAHVNHPIVGDPLYASGFATKANRLPEPLSQTIKSLSRQALHAAELGFEHPYTREEIHFVAPLPVDLALLDTQLRPFDTSRSAK